MSTASPSDGNSSEPRPASSGGRDGSPASKILKGKYEILDSIAETERCFVFKGRLLADGTDLAVKILKERFAQDPVFLDRYSAELRTTAALPAHSALLRYHEIDTMSRRFCVVSEFFSAPSLETLASGTSSMPYPSMLAVLHQLAALLELGYKEGLPSRVIRLEDALFRQSDRQLKLQRFGTPRGASVISRAAAGKPTGPAPDLLFLGVTMFGLASGRRQMPSKDEPAEAVADGLTETLKLRYPELTGNEVAGFVRLFVGTTTRTLGQRIEDYSGFEQGLGELERLSETLQAERRRAQEQRTLEAERDTFGSAYDTVALLSGQRSVGEAGDQAALNELARPLAAAQSQPDLEEEPGGWFSAANLAIAGVASLLLVMIYWLFYR
ncbi:MAG: hypothetical protein HY814_05290 [Candidatus Riflebacteria bacterium]|nr:hypothetical protein [Candidatus Riflebacteria bacterium]